MTSDFVQIDKKKDQKCNEPQYDIGGFHLLDLIIPELKSHVIPYKFKCSHWWKIHL